MAKMSHNPNPKPKPKKFDAPLGKPTTKKELAAQEKRLFGKGAMADGSLSIDQKMARNARARKQAQSRSYSPAPMSAAAKKKMAENAKPLARSLRKLKPLNLDKTAKSKKK